METIVARFVQKFPIIYDKRLRATPNYALELDAAYNSISKEIYKVHKIQFSSDEVKKTWSKRLTAYKKHLESEAARLHEQPSTSARTSQNRCVDGDPMHFMKKQLVHRPTLSSTLKQSAPPKKHKSSSRKRKTSKFVVPPMDQFAYGKAAQAQELVKSCGALRQICEGAEKALKCVKESSPPSDSYNLLLKKFYLVKKHNYDACLDEVLEFLDQVHSCPMDNFEAFKEKVRSEEL